MCVYVRRVGGEDWRESVVETRVLVDRIECGQLDLSTEEQEWLLLLGFGDRHWCPSSQGRKDIVSYSE